MGQSISGADVTYPNLWAVVPAAWKAAGGILNLPNMDGRVLMGGSGTLGAVGGANSHTLDVNRLAPHTHTIDHDHGVVTSGYVSNDHYHVVGLTTTGASHRHTHGVHSTGLTDMQGLHAHNSAYINHTALAAGSAMGIDRSMDAAPPAGGYMNLGTDTQGHHNHNVTVDGVTGGESVDHSHGVVGSTQGISANHYHVVDLPNYTGSSGNAGSGSVIDHTPSNLRINVAIKT
jgi:microcystin-dependent protein